MPLTNGIDMGAIFMRSREIAVSAGAVVKRRRVAGLGTVLEAMRPGRRRAYFGRFYLVGPDDMVTDKHVDLEQNGTRSRGSDGRRRIRPSSSDINDDV